MRTELTDALYAIGDRLASTPWWTKDWTFVRYKPDKGEQIFIGHRDWAIDGENRFMVWIGVEQFRPESILGTEAPKLYVWVPAQVGPRGAAAIRDALQAGGVLLGASGGKGYVARQDLHSSVDKTLEDYLAYAEGEFLTWCSHYAAQKRRIDLALRTVKR